MYLWRGIFLMKHGGIKILDLFLYMYLFLQACAVINI